MGNLFRCSIQLSYSGFPDAGFEPATNGSCSSPGIHRKNLFWPRERLTRQSGRQSSAGCQPAVSPAGSRQRVRSSVRRCAGCQPATQQTTSLRYLLAPSVRFRGSKLIVTTRSMKRVRALPLSYPGVWSRGRDSNPRPRALQACSSISIRHKIHRDNEGSGNEFALPTELRAGSPRHGRSRTGDQCSSPGICRGRFQADDERR